MEADVAAHRRLIHHNVAVLSAFPLASVFQDPAWVAVIVAVVAIPIGIAVPFVVARWQTGRKALAFGATGASLVRDTARGRLTVLFRDREVSSVALITVTLVNTGNQPIRREDFDGPLRIRYGESVEVLDAEISSVEPPGLRPALSVSDAASGSRPWVEIAPLLLNRHDSLSVEAIVNGHDGSIDSVSVEGRIAGVAEFGRFDDDVLTTGSLVAAAASVAAVDIGVGLLPGGRLVAALGTALGKSLKRPS